MTNDRSDQSVRNELSKLLREVDALEEAEDEPPPVDGGRQDASGFVSKVFRLSVFGMMCLGLGYWVGSSTANSLQSQKSHATDPSISAQQGWRAEGSGVFYRWCRGECHVPRLYGGGVSQVFEVSCAERPCGEIQMEFNVLDEKHNVVGEITRTESGLQGELRRFIIESPHPQAASIELSGFKAVARF